MNKIEQTEIAGQIVKYIEEDEADWYGIEEAIKKGQTKGFLYRYRTAIDVGEWWINDNDKMGQYHGNKS